MGMDTGGSKKDKPKKNQGSANSAIEQEQKRLEEAVIESKRRSSTTEALSDEEKRRLPALQQSAYGFRQKASGNFLTVPSNLSAIRERHALELWSWIIELHDLAPGKPPLGIELLSAAALGRDPSGEAADIDLSPYGATDKGVSRRHALLRPTKTRLYLIDLDSTNGTKRFGMPITPGMAVELRDRDMLTLADMTFTLRIIERPRAEQPPPTASTNAGPSPDQSDPNKTDTKPI